MSKNASAKSAPQPTTLALNKEAQRNFFIVEQFEAGIVLKGTEVKSIRLGKAQMRDSYAKIRNGELFLANLHVSPYEFGNRYNQDPLRERKLLLHRKEIEKLQIAVKEKGLTLVPLSLYLKNGKIKVKIATAKGKKLHDKRQDLKAKEAKREMERVLKSR